MDATLPTMVEHYIDQWAQRGSTPRGKEPARLLGRSRWSLYRACSGHSRRPLSDHLRHRQIAIAQELEERSEPIPAIACRSGFAGARQLHRVFRRVLSATPGEFRRD